jgi:hypothetical protein
VTEKGVKEQNQSNIGTTIKAKREKRRKKELKGA